MPLFLMTVYSSTCLFIFLFVRLSICIYVCMSHCVLLVCLSVRVKFDQRQCGSYHCEASVGEVKVSSDKAIVRLAYQQEKGNSEGMSGVVVQVTR